MIEKLRAKPGGAEIDVMLGDFADVPVEGSFALVYMDPPGPIPYKYLP